jgi:hypothetical protein
MNDRIEESKDHSLSESRANLFFLLQRLAQETHARAILKKSRESSVTDEQLPEYKEERCDPLA